MAVAVLSASPTSRLHTVGRITRTFISDCTLKYRAFRQAYTTTAYTNCLNKDRPIRQQLTPIA